MADSEGKVKYILIPEAAYAEVEHTSHAARNYLTNAVEW